MSSSELAELLDRTQPGRAPWVVLRDISGGSQGAYLVAGGRGTAAVAKVHAGATLEWFGPVGSRVDRLRARGVPAPHMEVLAVDKGIVLLLDFMPGEPDNPLTVPLVEALLDINRRQAGAADAPADGWQRLMQRSLSRGLDGYCEHSSLRGFNDLSRHHLARIHSLARVVDFAALPADDLVHYDLHPSNILSVDGRTVSGIVDWDAVTTGDRLLDVAMLTFTAMRRADKAVLERLWSEFFSLGDDTRRAVAMHHVVLRLVDWMIRHEAADVADRTIREAASAFAILDAGRYVSVFPS